ncbi:MAG TPA: O-antigen polymerase, partial [Thermoanaerobaculia bacterium]|nr:O-antigen polymerase [Thermoanaerobaculia bacterium]
VHNALSTREINPSYLFLYYLGLAGAILMGYVMIVLRRRPAFLDVALLALMIGAMGISTERTALLWAVASWLFFFLLPPGGDRAPGRMLLGGLVAGLIALGLYLTVGEWLGKSPENISSRLMAEAERAASEKRVENGPHATGRAPASIAVGKSSAPRQAARSESRAALLLPGGLFHKFAVLYMATAPPVVALDQSLHEPAHSRFGFHTFYPVWRVLERMRWVETVPRPAFYENVSTPYPSNAYTFLYEYARDFGHVGAVMCAGLLGLLSGWIYRRAETRPAPSVWHLVLGQIQVMVLWSPFANRFMHTVNWYILGLLIAGGLWALRAGRTVSVTRTKS